MLTKILLVLIVFSSLCYGRVFDPYSRRYNIFKASMDTLLDTPSGATHTTLIQGFYNLTTKAALTAAENTTFITWVQDVETNIVQDAAIPTENEKFLRIGAAMQQLSLEQAVIFRKVEYLNISTWSAFENVIHITREWTFESSLELILQTSASGDCKLFDLLLAASASDPARQAALATFIDTDLKAIISNTSMSQREIAVAVHKAFEEDFFVGAQASWRSWFYGLQLNGFYAFSQWSDAANSFYQDTVWESILSGQGFDCPLILAMNATLTNSTYTNTQKGFIKNLMNYFIQQFETNATTPEARLLLISMKFSETIDLSYSYFAAVGSIPIPNWGSFYQLIIFSCQYTTFPIDCGCVPPTWIPEPGSTLPGEGGSTTVSDVSGATDVTEPATDITEPSTDVTVPSDATAESSGVTDVTLPFTDVTEPSESTSDSSAATDVTQPSESTSDSSGATDATAVTSPSSDNTDSTDITPSPSGATDASDATSEASPATDATAATSPSSDTTDSSDSTAASSLATEVTDATSNASDSTDITSATGATSQVTDASSLFTTASIVPSTVSDCECLCA